MALDINQSEKAVKRIIATAGDQPGNRFVPGITQSSWNTKALEQEQYLYGSFFFPVDSYIWNAGAEFTSSVGMKQIESDYEAANGLVQYGIQFFSSRDKLYDDGTGKGRTPYLPATKETKDSSGNDMEWDAYASPTPGVPIAPVVNTGTQLPTHGIGWLNKPARMQLAFGTMSTGNPGKKVNINFTKKVGKGRKSKKRGFDVSAGTKLVFWMRNISGGSDSESEVKINAAITPRIAFVPKQDIVQEVTYEDQARARWNDVTAIRARTANGQGIQTFWTAPMVRPFTDIN